MNIIDSNNLDAQAAAFLSADLESARAELARIDDELSKLQARRRAVEWKISALTPGARAAHQDRITTGTGVPEVAGGQMSVATRQVAGTNASDALAQTGFRDFIRSVLRDAERGLKPKEVAARVIERGFPYKGTTPIALRVSNDLHRLLQQGNVRRRSGLYYIAEKGDTSSPN